MKSIHCTYRNYTIILRIAENIKAFSRPCYIRGDFWRPECTWFLPRCIVCKRGLRDRNAVCLSVTRVYCEKTNDSSANILTSFLTRRMVGGGRPLLPEIRGGTLSLSLQNGDFHSIFARSGSTLGPSEKVQLRLI